jgi:benzoate-CoA ligase
METQTESHYKYEKYVPEYYNITSKLIDETVAKGFGDKILVYYKDQTYTYKEMQSMINRVGNALYMLGVHMEEKVMLVMYDSPEAMASFYGAIKIGAVPVPVNYMYTSDEFRYLLNDSRARTLIAHADFVEAIDEWREKLRYLENTIILGDRTKSYQIGYHDIVDRCSDKLEVAWTTYEDVGIWNYTSGVTGIPKPVVHLQHDVFTGLENYAKGTLQLNQNDILFSAYKVFSAYGMGNTFIYPPGIGASVVLLPDKMTPEIVLATIEQYKPTVLFGAPRLYAGMLEIMDKEKKYDVSSLRLCISALEPLAKDVYFEWEKRTGQQILDGIGSAELINIFISNRPGDVMPGSSGKIVTGYAAKIVDDDGREVPDGEVGNLYVKGESMAAFYYGQHDRTKSTMLGEWFNTGDKYYRDAAGYYYYYGRSDDMLKVGKTLVSPMEIENTLREHPAVAEAAVIAKEDENGLEKPKAYVVLKAGYEPSEELAKEIQAFAKKSIVSYKYPEWVEFINELPKTATGKLQRYKLRG